MKFLRFLPRSRAKQAVWMEHFRSTLPQYSAELKLDPEHMAWVNDFTQRFITCHNNLVTYRKKFESARDELRQLQREIFSVQGGLGGLISVIKSKPSYTDGIGAGLGIVGHSIPVIYDEYSPWFILRIRGENCVEVCFRRHYADAVNIYSRRGTEESFSFLARTSVSPYMDTRPNINPEVPEIRDYRICLVRNYETIGRLSDIKRIIIYNGNES